jgi:hypothetical protein
MEGFDKNDEFKEEIDGKFRQEIYSKAVRAGKRTYFFDVKSTRNDEYYLTITESKKRYEQDGKFHFEKHKIFLYKEDFEKFADGLGEVVEFIKQQQPGDLDELPSQTDDKKEENYQSYDLNDESGEEEEEVVNNYTNVEFEDI